MEIADFSAESTSRIPSRKNNIFIPVTMRQLMIYATLMYNCTCYLNPSEKNIALLQIETVKENYTCIILYYKISSKFWTFLVEILVCYTNS